MKALSKKGFTLVEIMIVVVIIGLLAALAIPAFKKVRNTAIEKTLINDGRQLSSAAQQYFSENSATTVTVDLLIGNNRNLQKLSSGNILVQGVSAASTATPTVQAAFTGINLDTSSGTAANRVFSIFNANYETTLSSNGRISGDVVAPNVSGGYGAAASPSHHLNFAVDSGEILTAAGLRWNNDGTLGTAP